LTAFRHPVFARVYTFLSRMGESAGAAEHRQELLRGLSGRVVELGAGNGVNFAHYPPATTEVVAVEPEPYLRDRAREAAAAARVSVRVTDGLGGALPLR
jgi:protein-L-isoaspartate O-methyltransferase